MPNPLGVVGVLTAFNFPVAVYGWCVAVPINCLYALRLISKSRNLSLSLVAGNATIWKPSPTTPLCAIATTRIVADVLEKNGLPGAIASLAVGDQDIGEAIVESPDVPLGKYPFYVCLRGC